MSQTVIIGCKTSNGFLMEAQVGGKSVEIRINGFNRQVIEGGYGLTHDVPLEVWNQWRERHKDSKLVRNGLVFAQAKEKEAKAQSEDGKDNKSGMEPLKPVTRKSKDAKAGQLAAAD